MRVRWLTENYPDPEVAPVLNWLYRWPFISPMLSISRHYLNLEQRVRAESAIDTVADLLVSSEPIDTPYCLASQAMHLTYLICIIAAGQSLECCLYEPKQKNTLSVGAHHYHARQALMGWDSIFLTIFQDLSDISELHCEAAKIPITDVINGIKPKEIACKCAMGCYKWFLVSKVLEHLFHARITIYEMQFMARFCGFSFDELEEDLLVNEDLLCPIEYAVILDDINVLQRLDQSIKESDLENTVKCISHLATTIPGHDLSADCDIFDSARILLSIGRLPEKITKWFAFGTSDMVETCVNDIPIKPCLENMDRWESMKRDLKNVTEAMVGILPPEDVVNRFTSFLDARNTRKKGHRSNSIAT